MTADDHGVFLHCRLTVCGVGIGWGDAIWIVTLPLLLAAGIVSVMSPPPRHLKQYGWSLLAINIISGIAAIGMWNY